MDRDVRTRMMSSPAEFRARLAIDTDAGPRLLGEVAEPWQRQDFETLDAAWLRIANKAGNGCRMRAYLERPRGHSKTADLAVMATWALFASRRHLTGVAAAADQEQSALLREAVSRLLAMNTWLAAVLDVQRFRIVNKHTESTLRILASDAASSYGLTPSFIIVDELCHWPKRDLWDSLLSASAKRARCLLVIISNAGTGQGTSWQWRVREHARQSAKWHFSRLDGPAASWITEDRLQEQRELLPPTAFSRLWLNNWTVEGGDCLSAEDIAAAVRLEEPPEPDADHVFVGGLDIGVKNDRSAFVVLGTRPGSQRVYLAAARSWRPMPGGEVDLAAVREEVHALCKQWRVAWVGYDPDQAKLAAQELVARGVPMAEIRFVPKNLDAMAQSIVQGFHQRRIDLYREELLLADLARLSIVQRKWGYKLEAPRDASGHADTAIAFAIALPAALEESQRVAVEQREVYWEPAPFAGAWR